MDNKFTFLRGKELGFNDLEFVSRNIDVFGEDADRLDIILKMGMGLVLFVTCSPAGYSEGTYECAVIGRDGELTYDTGITDDVIGYCTEHDVSHIMKLINNLT